MAYRNKTYVCFDADNDMSYYRTMQMWKANDKIDFDFHNAHELNNLRSTSSEETIKRKLKERLVNTKLCMVLVGTQTKNLYKFVRWEIEVALELGIPIVVVNLNNSRTLDNDKCPPILKDKLALHIAYKQKAMTWAIDNWIKGNEININEGNIEPRILTSDTYKSLGLEAI
jgi:predicted membrane-bound dolichyl-phosphate-mannose-protein mannosyltransferase